MKTDLYIKIVLTLIAGLLAVNLFVAGPLKTVSAQTGYRLYQVQEEDGALKGRDGKAVSGEIVGFSCMQNPHSAQSTCRVLVR
jgi:hypothetical protein